MPNQITVLRVFVASPSDVCDERILLEEVIHELNKTWSRTLGITLDLVKWETDAFPSIGDYPQSVINSQIGDDYDIFIGILWKRFGTPTPKGGSGTAEEFFRAYDRYKTNPNAIRNMFYFNNTPVPINEIDPKELMAINEFRSQLSDLGQLYWTYTNLKDFESLVRMHLSRQIQDWQIGWGGSVSESGRNLAKQTNHSSTIPSPNYEAIEAGRGE